MDPAGVKGYSRVKGVYVSETKRNHCGVCQDYLREIISWIQQESKEILV